MARTGFSGLSPISFIIVTAVASDETGLMNAASPVSSTGWVTPISLVSFSLSRSRIMTRSQPLIVHLAKSLLTQLGKGPMPVL